MSQLVIAPRQQTHRLSVGNVPVGAGAPISVQSMTNTSTLDVGATVAQVRALQLAGADIVRISVPTMEAVKTFGQIRRQIDIPLVADVHFDYRIALAVLKEGVDCLRVNPGNLGKKERLRAVVLAAQDTGTPLRIGVNAGSLEKSLQKKYGEPCAEALVESALLQADQLAQLNFSDFKISVKASDVFMSVAAYRQLSSLIKQPLHLGITEAGGLLAGTVKSAFGLGLLLSEGIGDTIRISLAADPVEEVKVAWHLLKTLKLRNRGIHFVACPGCARQNFDVASLLNDLEERLQDVRIPLKVAVMGCIVNGPGEAKTAQIGLVGGTTQQAVFINGRLARKLPTHTGSQKALVDAVEAIVRDEVCKQQIFEQSTEIVSEEKE